MEIHPVTIDHGILLGLGDVADHLLYLDLAGTRAMTGSLDMGTNAITNAGAVGCGGITSSGNFSFTNANPDIKGGDDNGVLSITADTATNQGGNIKLYGNNHATLASDIEFYADATKILEWDESEDFWDFRGTKVVNMGGLAMHGLSLPKAQLEFGAGVPVIGSMSTLYMGFNCYYDGSWKRIIEDTNSHNVMLSVHSDGEFNIWTNTDSNTAEDSAIVWNSRLNLNKVGDLTIDGDFACDDLTAQTITIGEISSDADFSIQPDIPGDIYCFGDTDVANATTDGKSLYVYRKAAAPDADHYVKIYVDQYMQGGMYSSNHMLLNAAGYMYIQSATDIYFKLGDAAGVEEVRVLDSAAATVATIDSDGNAQFDGTMAVGGNTDLSGTVSTTSDDNWDLNDYTGGTVTDTGYVTVTINGTAYKLLARLEP
jgi:hypothetical protein